MKQKKPIKKAVVGLMLGIPYRYTQEDLESIYNKLYNDCLKKFRLEEKDAQFLATEFTATIRERLQSQRA